MVNFTVEATIEIPLKAKMNPSDEVAVGRWLKRQFDHCDGDFTINRRRKLVTARVQHSVNLDLSKVKGGSLKAQLKSLHGMAKQAFSEMFSIPIEQIYQLDILVSD
ncbi:MAG: hypothetical protein WCO26_21130 [Deltaproteobacteria bacterium]